MVSRPEQRGWGWIRTLIGDEFNHYDVNLSRLHLVLLSFVLDTTNRFVTQRAFPVLLPLTAVTDDGTLYHSRQGAQFIHIPPMQQP